MLKKKVIYSCLLATVLCSAAYAKDEMPTSAPKAIDNKALDAMVGTWHGQSEMMGSKMNDTVKISWGLGHQFLVFELSSKSVTNPNNNYEGLGLFGIDSGNKVKAWWFDNWGAAAVSTGSGTVQGNTLQIKDGNPMFHEERTFQTKGNEMIMHAKGMMKMNGKETPFVQAVNYKKSG